MTMTIDFPLAELDALVPDLADALILETGLLAVEIGVPFTRLRTGELRWSWAENFAPGQNGGTDRPPAGLSRHPRPRGDSVRAAVKARRLGEGISAKSLVVQRFYLEEGFDDTFGRIVSQLPGVMIQ